MRESGPRPAESQDKGISPILCQLLLQAQQAFFIPGLHQFMNQGSGREEADGEPLLAGRQTETEGDMGLLFYLYSSDRRAPGRSHEIACRTAAGNAC